MSRLPRVVVVVAYGRADLLERALDGLDDSETAIVVDNSRDPDVRATVERHRARYVDAGHNRGFAGGVNLALTIVRDEQLAGDVLLLNPDAVITSAQVDDLVRALRSAPDVGAAAPALVGPDGGPQQARWPFPSPGLMWREAVGLAPTPPADAGFVVGAVLLLRREALREVGGFDERYFLYAEEADWQRRAAAAGWRAIVLSGTRVVHDGAATSTDPIARDARFFAAQEIFVRRWSGTRGWLSYRAAALLGAAARSVVLRPQARSQATNRARTFARGPIRTAALPAAGRRLRVTHVVVTANLAGTERYVIDLARAQAAAGNDVRVVGGAPGAMQRLLGPDVDWVPGSTLAQAVRALGDGGVRDVVHTHLTSADFAGALTGAIHGARLVSTRHIAARRGSSLPARLAAAVLQRRIDAEICISEFVQAATGRRAVVVPNGVGIDVRTAEPTGRRIVVAQRLEAEKRTDIALEAWRRSGLADEGWTLAIAGEGALRGGLERTPGLVGVEWLGWLPDLRTLLLESAALLAPAPGEPFGLAVVEAMSIGLPVVAAAAGGHLETVGAVDGALLFTADDPDDCARALRAFARLTPDERRAYGAKLRMAQRARLGLHEHVEAVEAVYRNAGRDPKPG